MALLVHDFIDDAGNPKASGRKLTTHGQHIWRFVRRGRTRVFGSSPAALQERPCDGCGNPICCLYGQKTVKRTEFSVWSLHPWCSPPETP